MTIPKLKFSQNILLCVLFSLVQIFIIHKSISIYIPLLFTVIFSLIYGLLEPKKGWLLALIQVILLIMGYWILNIAGYKATKPDEAIFATHVSFFPSFAASFLTGFLFKSN